MIGKLWLALKAILPDISRSKDNQAMDLSQTFYLKIHAESEAEILVLGFLLFFKKLYIRQKQVVSILVLICFGRLQLGKYVSEHTFFTSMINSFIFRCISPEI